MATQDIEVWLEKIVERVAEAVRHVDGIPLHVLPLEGVIASKRATKRPKDLVVLPALEATVAAQPGAEEP